MWWLIWIGLALVAILALAFAVVLPFGAPYLPTLEEQSSQALNLIDLKQGQVFVDLGCGDGRLLALAASKGLKAIGYELNPILAVYAWLRTRRYGDQVKVKWGSFWRADLSKVDGVFVFLIGHYMKRLDRMLKRYSKDHQIKLVSHAFKIPGKKPLRKKGALLLYIYPAPKT